MKKRKAVFKQVVSLGFERFMEWAYALPCSEFERFLNGLQQHIELLEQKRMERANAPKRIRNRRKSSSRCPA